MIAALVPAAGRSVRMGRPKLLLEFDGQTLIRRVVSALREGGAERVVVVPPADAPEAAAIAAEAAAAGAEVIVPRHQPAEMRDSVELGLAVLDVDPAPVEHPAHARRRPRTHGGPGRPARADVAWTRPDRIVIPVHDGRRGHPIVLPWDVADQVARPAGRSPGSTPW